MKPCCTKKFCQIVQRGHRPIWCSMKKLLLALAWRPEFIARIFVVFVPLLLAGWIFTSCQNIRKAIWWAGHGDKDWKFVKPCGTKKFRQIVQRGHRPIWCSMKKLLLALAWRPEFIARIFVVFVPLLLAGWTRISLAAWNASSSRCSAKDEKY